MKQTMYRSLSMQKRKQLRDIINRAGALRREQIFLFEKEVIAPQRKLQAMSVQVLRNEISVESYLHASKRWFDRIEKIFGVK